MEWLFLLGSVASIISVLAVLLGLARRREAITEQGFKMLFALMVALTLTGVGAITMALAEQEDKVMKNTGSGVALTGAFLLAVIATVVVFTVVKKTTRARAA